MTTARLALKVKVTGQVQKSTPSTYGRGNAVTWSVTLILDQGQFF